MARDYYREMSYQDRCDARDNGDYEAVRSYDRDSESRDRAYESYRNGGDFSDPDSDGRFH